MILYWKDWKKKIYLTHELCNMLLHLKYNNLYSLAKKKYFSQGSEFVKRGWVCFRPLCTHYSSGRHFGIHELRTSYCTYGLLNADSATYHCHIFTAQWHKRAYDKLVRERHYIAARNCFPTREAKTSRSTISFPHVWWQNGVKDRFPFLTSLVQLVSYFCKKIPRKFKGGIWSDGQSAILPLCMEVSYYTSRFVRS